VDRLAVLAFIFPKLDLDSLLRQVEHEATESILVPHPLLSPGSGACRATTILGSSCDDVVFFSPSPYAESVAFVLLLVSSAAARLSLFFSFSVQLYFSFSNSVSPESVPSAPDSRGARVALVTSPRQADPSLSLLGHVLSV
jgi:hypothetical protein